MNINTKKREVIIWFIKLFFLVGYVFTEFLTEGRGYYHEFESLVIISIFFLGTFYCHQVCPYGIVSEIFEKAGKWILGKQRCKIQIPDKYDKKLRYIKYGFGIYFLYVFISGTANYWGDHGLMYQSTPVTSLYLFLKMFLGISFLSFFFDRFFCRYLCYQKAWYNIIEKLSLTKISINKSKCTSCRICESRCPMNIPVSQMKSIKSTGDCISCYNCVSDCPPRFNALNLKMFGKSVSEFKTIVYFAIIYFLLSWGWKVFNIEELIQALF